MENWEKIIKGYSQTSDNSTVKYIDAVVTDIGLQMTTASVRLITGQVVDNLPNKSGEKIFIGQNVMVGYRTSPTLAGWIAQAGGETNPLRLAGYDVETAAIFDLDNIHQWTAEQELIVDINANTKLLYGGSRRKIILQGYACRWSDSTTLTPDDASDFGTHMEFDTLWRETSTSDFQNCHHTIDLYIDSLTTNTTNGDTYTPRLMFKQYSSSGTLMHEFTIGMGYPCYAPLDIFIIPTVNSISFAPTYGNQPTPNGYVMNMNLNFRVGYISSNDPSTVVALFPYAGGQVGVWLSGYGSGGQNSYSCIPLDSLAEKCFDLAITKRTEPRALGG